jgi:HAD superfamily hydrolase (TIGR01509 family)
MKLHPKALLFDMDGVLVDSLDSWWYALNSALKTYGHPGLSREEFVQRFWGYDLYDNLRMLGLPSEIGLFCNRIYGQYLSSTKIYPETLPTLRQLDRFPKAVITNSPRSCVEEILRHFQLMPFFQVVVTSDEVKNGKPDPELVYTACRRLRVSPPQVVLIGDTINDVLAGHAAGCPVVGLNIKADETIHSLLELPKIL